MHDDRVCMYHREGDRRDLGQIFNMKNQLWQFMMPANSFHDEVFVYSL